MAKDQTRERAPEPAPSPPKKPYRAPRLVEYGDLRAITRTKGGMMNDGGLPSTRK